MKENRRSNKNKIIIFLGITILLIIIGVQYFRQQELKETIEVQKEEISATFNRLDSISVELKDRMIKLEEMGENIDSLLVAVNQLEEEKESLKRTGNINRRRIQELQKKADGYAILLKKKDEEIKKLEEVNQVLMSENTGLKVEKNELEDNINTLESNATELNKKVAKGAILKAQNLRIFKVKRNKKLEEGRSFRRGGLNEIKIEFAIAKNDLASLGGKEVVLRMIGPQGSVLFNTNDSGKIMINNEETFYTLKKEVEFNNTEQKVEFSFKKNTKYEKGTYTIQLYCEGLYMGRDTFVVR